MADEIAAARAGLKKSTVDNSKPTPSTNDMFVAKGKKEAAGDVRGQARLQDNGLDRVAVDKNAVADEHNFADARARLKKTNSARAAEDKPATKEGRLTTNGIDRVAVDKNSVEDDYSFADARSRLKKAGPAPVVKETEKNGRLVSNGIDREAEDKNKVEDEFDFASLRANLKKPGAEKVPDKKVAAAKARAPGQVGEAVISNQMFVSKKAAPKAVGDVRKEDRLQSNGMNRAADDKNAVGDEHDFASLRSNLRKTGA